MLIQAWELAADPRISVGKKCPPPKIERSAEKKFRKKMQGCFMQFLRLIFVKKLQLRGLRLLTPTGGVAPGPPPGALPPGPPLGSFCGPQAPTFQLTFPFLIPMPVIVLKEKNCTVYGK